jgi:taurine dioxygenase
MRLREIAAVIGSEVDDIDLAEPLDAAEAETLRRGLRERQVLVFRGQALSEDQHIALARSFGEIHYPPVPTKHGGPPEINVLDQASPRGDGADLWHNDNTYLEEPPLGSILKAVKIPAIGGDTCFASMLAAYDALSPALRGLIDGLEAEHDLTRQLHKAVRRGNSDLDIEATRKRFPPVVHPLVRVHPETGHRALFANSNATTRILGLREEESDLLLGLLFRHVNRPEFQCRVRWQEGTVVLFDNRCVQHYAVPDYSERRIMHRITIRGDRPLGPVAAA